MAPPKASVPVSAESEGTENAQRIVAAARQHFFENGFRSVTMDDLAAELAMSKKTLYACFPSKTALLEAVLASKVRDVEADLAVIGGDPRGDHPEALQQLLVCIQKHGDEIKPAFIRDVRREAPELFKIVEQGRRDVMKRNFTRILEAGRRSGALREDVSVELVIEMILASVDAIVNPLRMEQLNLTPRDGYAGILGVILHGVLKPSRASKR